MPKFSTEQTPLLIADADVEGASTTTACKPIPGGKAHCGHVECGTTNNTNAAVRARTMTPIPWRQLLTLCLVRLIDPICFSQIFPYINDMLLDMRVVGRNAPERAGFYSGLIESTFSVAVALAIYPWARLSGAFRCGHLCGWRGTECIFPSRQGWTETGAALWRHWRNGRDGQLWNGQ